MTDRARLAIENFLNTCGMREVVFEAQCGFSTASEAQAAGAEIWERFCELHRAIGREPPSWPAHLPKPQPETMI